MVNSLLFYLNTRGLKMVYVGLSDSTTQSQFTRRKAITVLTDGTTTPINYEVKLTISYESPMQADFSDLRFNTTDGRYLDYQIETYVSSSSATVWVKLIDSVADPGTDTIWMYYGNPNLDDGGVGSDVFNTYITNEGLWWDKYASNPLLVVGAVSSWDEKAVYVGVLPADISTGEPVLQGAGNDEYWLFYSGGGDTANPRHETSIGLAKSTDYKNPVKYVSNPVINRSAVGQGDADEGIAVMDIKYFNSKYYMVLSSNHPGEVTNISMMESVDLLTWTNYTDVLTANDRDHAAYIIEDPDDDTKLIMYYSYIPGGESFFKIGRATATKASPYTWTEDGVNNPILAVANNNVLYPFVEYVDGVYNLYYSKYTDGGTKIKVFHTSNSVDTSFSDTEIVVIPYGSPGAWDDKYSSASRKYTDGTNDWIYYTARKDPSNIYTGVGIVEWKNTGILTEWDVATDPVGTSSLHAYSGDYGAFLTGINPQTSLFQKNVTNNNAIYKAYFYDDGLTTLDYQNVFRLYDSSGNDPLAGFDTDTSTTKYVYRAEGGVFTASSVDRSVGWHSISFVVKTTTTDVYIDDTLLFTETNFDESNVASIRNYGNRCEIGYIDLVFERKYIADEPIVSYGLEKHQRKILKFM